MRFPQARQGTPLRFGPGGGIPPMVKTLLLLNVGVFVLDNMTGGDLARSFGLIPNQVFAQGRVYQLLSYMFLHGGFFHIFFNMFMLWMFGSSIERAWGQREFITYYLVCGVGGGLCMWLTGPGSPVPTIGASGAVLGLLLAYAMMYPDREILLYFLFPIKMKYFIWILAAVDLLAGLGSSGSNVAHFAHLGGMLFGWLYLKQDWRLASMGRKLRGQRARAQMQQNVRRAEQRQREVESVDEILDKITTQGIESLTERERRILREASRQ